MGIYIMENQIDISNIISFLSSDKRVSKKINTIKHEEKKSLKYLEYYNSENFNNFKDILSNDVDRVGIRENNLLDNSLYFSVAFLLFENFNILEEKDQNFIIYKLKDKIKDDFISSKFSINYRLKKLKIILNNKLNTLEDAYILSKYFKVNIYIFNSLDNKITAIYDEDKINIYKPNIFLSYMDNVFYPLVYKMNNGTLFKYNSTILNNLLFSKYVVSYKHDEFTISNSWNEILKDYLEIDTSNIIVDKLPDKLKLEDSDSENSFNIDDLNIELNQYDENSSDDPFDNISIDIDEKKYDFNNLQKYKKNELQDLIKSNNFDINFNSKSTKSYLIKEIENKVNTNNDLV